MKIGDAILIAEQKGKPICRKSKKPQTGELYNRIRPIRHDKEILSQFVKRDEIETEGSWRPTPEELAADDWVIDEPEENKIGATAIYSKVFSMECDMLAKRFDMERQIESIKKRTVIMAWIMAMISITMMITSIALK